MSFQLKGTFPFIGDPNSSISRSIQIGMFGHTFEGEEYSEMIKDSIEKASRKTLPLSRKISMFFQMIPNLLYPARLLRQAKKDIEYLDLFRGKMIFTAKDIFNSILGDNRSLAVIHYAHGNASFGSLFYNLVLLNILKRNNPNNESNKF